MALETVGRGALPPILLSSRLRTVRFRSFPREWGRSPDKKDDVSRCSIDHDKNVAPWVVVSRSEVPYRAGHHHQIISSLFLEAVLPSADQVGYGRQNHCCHRRNIFKKSGFTLPAAVIVTR